jgi:hypothetical protein
MSDLERNSILNAIRMHEALAEACDGSPEARCRGAMHAAIAQTMRAQAGLLSQR